MPSNTTTISSSCASTKAPPVPSELLLTIFDHLSLFDLLATALVCRNWFIQADRSIWTRHPVPLEVAMHRIDLLRTRRESCQSLPITHIKLRNASLDANLSQYLEHLKSSYGSPLFPNLRQLSIAVDRDVTRLLSVFPLSTLESVSFRSLGISSLRAARILQHLAACSTLRRLEFVHPSVPFPTSAEAVTLPALRELSMHVRRNTGALVQAIEAPNLQSLKLYQELYPTLGVGTLECLAGRYPMLEHITLRLDQRWNSSSMLYSIISHPQLRSLTLVLRHVAYWNLMDEQYESISKNLSRLAIERPIVDGIMRSTLTSEALIKLSRHVPALQQLSFSLDLRGSNSIPEDLQEFPLLKALRLKICSSFDPPEYGLSWSDVANWLVRACPKLTHFKVQLHGVWSDGEGECEPAAVFWEHHKRCWGVEMQGVSPPSSPGWRQL